jgi:hypothetical protein
VPTTLAGKSTSRRNSLKHGLTAGAQLLTPDQERSLPEVLAPWQARYAHLTHPDAPRLLRDLAVASIRIDQCQNTDSALSSHHRNPSLAQREADLAAAETFDQLHLAPELTVKRLEQSAAGCNRLIQAWQSLTRRVELNLSWPLEQFRHALDLLGLNAYELETHPDAIALTTALAALQVPNPKTASNPEANLAPLRNLLTLFTRKIHDLTVLRNQHQADTDALDALGPITPDPTPRLQRLRRYESANRRLYRACLKALDALDAAESEPEPESESESKPESAPSLPTPRPSGEVAGQRPAGEGPPPSSPGSFGQSRPAQLNSAQSNPSDSLHCINDLSLIAHEPLTAAHP